MKCPGCNKFCSLALGDPDVELEVDEDGAVNGTVEITLTSECCGEDMKQYAFDIEHQMVLKKKVLTQEEVDASAVEGETWPSNECSHASHDKCTGQAVNGDGNVAPCSCPCHDDVELEVEGEAEIEETTIKGKKAYGLDLMITVSGDSLEEEAKATITTAVLSADMEELV